jgi:hypothetical protein
MNWSSGVRQFRLRTVMVLLTLIGIGLAAIANWRIRAERQAACLRPFVAMGGKVKYDNDAEGETVAWLAGVFGWDAVSAVRSISLSHTRVSDVDLERLAALRGPFSLHLSDTAVSDEGLRRLSGADIDALYVDRCFITDAGLRELRNWQQLKVLSARSAKVTDRGVRELVNLRRAFKLVLDDTDVTGECFCAYSAHESLSVLSLRGCPVTEHGLRCVANVPNLRVLDLGRTSLSDDALTLLTQSRRLESLHLDRTCVTEEGAAQFNRLMPSVTVFRDVARIRGMSGNEPERREPVLPPMKK